MVVLRPVSDSLGSLLPHGEVGPDGSFRIETYEPGDGAPAGEYIVLITWPDLKTDPGGGEVAVGDRLNGRFKDPAKSPWKVLIKEGNNELEPFRLD